jgi:hypothetical protein
MIPTQTLEETGSQITGRTLLLTHHKPRSRLPLTTIII